MTRNTLASMLLIAGVVATAPAWAQTSAQKQPTQDGNSPTTVGPGSAAYKQKTQDGNSPTTVGPGSAAYKQQTQSLSHAAPPSGETSKN